MITKIDFLKIIEAQQKFDEAITRISEAIFGNKYTTLGESDWCEAQDIIFKKLLDAYFTEEGQDWIFWWLYEDVDKIIYDKDPNSINKIEIPVINPGQLYDFLCRDPKTYFKNV